MFRSLPVTSFLLCLVGAKRKAKRQVALVEKNVPHLATNEIRPPMMAAVNY